MNNSSGVPAKIAGPSAMSLFLEMKFNGTPLATGTGFVAVSPKGPVLVTNRHNVTGRRPDNDQPLSSTRGVPNELTIIHNVKDQLGSWRSCREPLYDDLKPRWIEHPTLGQTADMIALPLTQLESVALYPYDPSHPGQDIAIGPADTVSVVGFPFGVRGGGFLGVWATGFVASEPDIDYNNLPVFLIDCRSRPGQSGSPVISYRAGGAVAIRDGTSAIFDGPVYRLLGLYSGRINAESDLGIVWKVRTVAELVDSVK